MRSCPATIAAINGSRSLLLGWRSPADPRLSKEARVGLPEVILGATPGAGGVQKLHRFVGRGKALEWILLAKHLSADELLPHGLLYAAVEPGTELEAAIELARALRRLSPNAIAQAKTSITSPMTATPEARVRGLEA